MVWRCQRAAVLGAGVMGAQIAAHLANAGVEVLLVDVSREAAAKGLERLRAITPDPCFVPEVLARIRTAAIDDLSPLATADWVIEAVVESLEVKRELVARIEPYVAPSAIVSSNTSAIPLSEIVDGRSPAFRRRWLGVHFFNPPRYLHLVELIPTTATDPEVTGALAAWLDRRLGKGPVVANDAPGFIANRIGVFGALRLVEAFESGEFTIEEIDALTGRLIGRPKSATFRTLDLAGLDIAARVATDLAGRLGAEDGETSFRVPRVYLGARRAWRVRRKDRQRLLLEDEKPRRQLSHPRARSEDARVSRARAGHTAVDWRRRRD